MKSHRSRRVAAGAAVVLSLTLAGCAQADPGVAARAGDTVVSEDDVQVAVNELAELPLPQQMPADMVTRYIAYAPTVTSELRQAGAPISQADVRKNLPDARAQLSQPTLDFLTTLTAVGMAQQAQQALAQPAPGFTHAQAQHAQKVLQAVQKADQKISQEIDAGQITFNPKYVRTQNNWIQQDVQAAQQNPQG